MLLCYINSNNKKKMSGGEPPVVTEVTAITDGEPPVVTEVTAITDGEPPVVTEVTAIIDGENTSPEYTFSSDTAGTFTVTNTNGEDIKLNPVISEISDANTNTTITFDSLQPGTYSDLKITVTNASGKSGVLNISEFTITEATDPTVTVTTSSVLTEITPIDDTNTINPSYTFKSSTEGSFEVKNDTTTIKPEQNISVDEEVTIVFDSLQPGSYDSIQIVFTSADKSITESLNVNSFTITPETITNDQDTSSRAQEVVDAECVVDKNLLEQIDKQLLNCNNITFKGGYNYNNNYAKY